MNRGRILSGIVTALVVASVIATYLQSSPVDVARAHVSEQGIPVESLSPLSNDSSDAIVAASASGKWQVKGAAPPKNVVVELRRPVYFLPWQVVEYRAEVAE